MDNYKSGHYVLGSDLIKHRGKTTRTIVTNPEANYFIENLDTLDFEFGVVPMAFANRPDLISNVFYATPKHWWLLSIMNNEPDPFEGFSSGERIRIPTNVT